MALTKLAYYVTELITTLKMFMGHVLKTKRCDSFVTVNFYKSQQAKTLNFHASANVIKLFTAVIYEFFNKLEHLSLAGFVLSRVFQPSLCG